MPILDEKLTALLPDLPDEKGARLFLDRLAQEHPRVLRSLLKQPGLLSDVLALAAWSPLLGTTLEQSPDYVSWLNRERQNSRVRTPEELKESLARFALTHSSLDPQVLLARFRRRELLRIYLHDLRRTHTIVETTEELSNLADAILDYALSLARQDLENKYGTPQFVDERGRVATAEFCIVALGKLGSHELNYASDIDLLFLYSDDGKTSGTGRRGEVTNREYFVKLAEAVTRLVGQPTGEGAAYRVDLRLRPFGRDGALASSLHEAVRYYHENAQRWELQALIRARAAAGWPALYARFAPAVRGQIFRADVSVRDALASVRIAKQKIDDQESQKNRGFNVKLGRGGIREIEFVAQALQLAHAGRDPWLRVPHTLIILGRLADRDLISEQERSELSDAYSFLRMVEHRVQMEHGLQAHNVPLDVAPRTLLARRMNFAGAAALAEFEAALVLHSSDVRRAYERVFGKGAVVEDRPDSKSEVSLIFEASSGRPEMAESAAAYSAASVFASRLPRLIPTEARVEALAGLLQDEASSSLDRHRALMLVARIASSLDKSSNQVVISEGNLRSLVKLCGGSELFGEMIAANPDLISALAGGQIRSRDYRAMLRASIDVEKNFAAELSTLRGTWSRLLLEIGNADAGGELSLFESNRLQTELAVASINAAYLIARRELARRFGNPAGGPRLAILGLGRLASSGVDYGSDLDIILIYDSAVPSPVASLTQDEAYARLGEMMISALSSITRTGHLYHVDLRLRPDGNDGPLVSSSQAFLDYLRQRAVVWEWLAYVKLRAVAGDLELGKSIETAARQIIHEAACRIACEELQSETRRVRDRLEQETVKPGRRGVLDIKHGEGGMLDVYFATRYLQLRHNVPDQGKDRSTLSTLASLKTAGTLSAEDYEVLNRGYSLLRSVDHERRLLQGRLARLPAFDHPTMRDIAKKLKYESAVELIKALSENMASIRAAYTRITQAPDL
ncbi:MAG: glutamate-ammonia-ligase adenylyltransferase [Acidobacteria bacterium]|nr:glutamate-ammonia-ligase adenylyltransferase [Acidobacteriota bacterium]